MKKSILIVLLSFVSLLNHSSDLTTTHENLHLLKKEKLYLEDSYANARMRLFSLFAVAIGVSGLSATLFCSNFKCLHEEMNKHIGGYFTIYKEYEKTPSPSLLSDKIRGSTIITASITALIPHMLEAYNDLQKASKKIAEIGQQIKMLELT